VTRVLINYGYRMKWWLKKKAVYTITTKVTQDSRKNWRRVCMWKVNDSFHLLQNISILSGSLNLVNDIKQKNDLKVLHVLSIILSSHNKSKDSTKLVCENYKTCEKKLSVELKVF
jgi:hypothetical protein